MPSVRYVIDFGDPGTHALFRFSLCAGNQIHRRSLPGSYRSLGSYRCGAVELCAEVLESETIRSCMKQWKKVFGAMLGGFLLFAPPGTLIFLSLILAGLFGRRWLIAVFVVASAALAILIVRRRSLGRPLLIDNPKTE